MNTRLTFYIDHAAQTVELYDTDENCLMGMVPWSDLLDATYEVSAGGAPWNTERVGWWELNSIDLRAELEAKARQWAQGITSEPFSIEHI